VYHDVLQERAMSRYHLFKGTRGYAGRPYQGPSNDGMPAEADSLAEAHLIRARLMERNPGVGWGIHDTLLAEDIKFNGEETS
jgi:hypothetical protein